MKKRDYNVLFHTHTVSGIVISVVLYVIFLCGAFSLFKDEITAWEKGEIVNLEKVNTIDIDRLVDTLNQRGYNLYGRDIIIRKADVKQKMYVQLKPSQDSLVTNDPDKLYYFNIHSDTYELTTYYDFYSVGEFIYRLHFFSQIPTIGIYLAGFVAFFMLFAIVTGVLIHWKKIVGNFFLFRPTKKMKIVWSDAHTVLGIIGLPFQFMFGLTSCFLALSILVLIPANYLYDNDQTKLLEDLRPMMKSEILVGKTDDIYALNPLMKESLTKWDQFSPEIIQVKNYGAKNMSLQVDGTLDSKDKFIGNGRIIYDVFTRKIKSIKDPYLSEYNESVEFFARKMHYGDYGGMLVKVMYFILALITCFVIISGVLIWLEARNKKNISIPKRLYNLNVGHVYLAISLTLYPVIASGLLFAKLLPRSLDDIRQSIIYTFFFGTWLLSAVFFRYKRDNFFTTKYTLMLGAVLGVLIPIINGFTSGNWIWVTFLEKQNAILFVDLLWLCLSITSFIIVSKMKTKTSDNEYQKLLEKSEKKLIIKNNNKMRIGKIAFLWMFIAVGFIFHHIYGLATVFFNESVVIEGSNGEIPFWVHKWRLFMEGMALLFGLLTIEISKKWFQWVSFIWAIVIGLFNIYHLITASIYELSNISEIWILLLTVVANIFLVKHIYHWIYKK